MTLSTHVLDTSIGRPAANVAVTLYRQDGGDWRAVGRACTDGDGRVAALLAADGPQSPGAYQIVFDVGAYFSGRGAEAFYQQIRVDFVVADAAAHYHVPLLVSPYGYSTYRGS